MSRQNYRSKYIALKDKVFKLEAEFKQLCEKYDKVVGDKKDLSLKFEKLTQ